MTILAHLSDTHFGTELPKVAAAVERALLALKPDIVTITGDLTQRARPSQFRATKAFLDGLPADLKFVIPGNHDIPLFNLPLRLLDPYSNYTPVFGLREGVWCHDDIGIIGYNATSRWRHTRGKLMEQTIREHVTFARSQLKPGALLVACAHQPLAVALPQDQENVLVDAPHVATIFADNGVDVVLSGHVHMPLITTTETRFPNLKRHFVLSGAGTAVSHRTRPGAPNSFNVIHLEGSGEGASIAIDLMEYQANDEQFARTSTSTFTLRSNGWKQLPR